MISDVEINIPKTDADEEMNRILLISPLGRAGSSWIGEELSKIDENTYYVYEPISGYWRNNIGEVIATASFDVIFSIFSCNFSKWLVDFNHDKWRSTLLYFRRKCGNNCKTLDDFNSRCKYANTFIIKVRIFLFLKSLY